MIRIMSQPWFFGPIERPEAEDVLLAKKKKGTFLVRLNLGGSEEPSISPFVISKINKNQQVEHIRVYVDPTGLIYYFLFVFCKFSEVITFSRNLGDWENKYNLEMKLFVGIWSP